MKKVNSFLLLFFFLYFILLIFLSHKFLFFKRWFYTFIWWGYILFFDLYFRKIRGFSLFSRGIFKFLRGIFFSVFIWNIFEIYNLILKNWSYYNLPISRYERYLGYFLGFGTVVYGILISTEILFYLFGGKIFEIDIYSFFLGRKKFSLFLGITFLILPLLFSRYFFPLIWLSFIFLFVPMFKKLPEVFPFLKEINYVEKFNFILLGGLLSGFLWEFWNYFALSRWKYHLPFLNSPKIFEMPIAGFGGFLPFAIEVYFLYSFLIYLEGKLSLIQKILFYIFIFLEIFLTFTLIDKFTVIWY